MRKSVENLLVSSHDVIGSSISSISSSLPFSAMTLPTNPSHGPVDARSPPSPSASPQASPRPSPRQPHRRHPSRSDLTNMLLDRSEPPEDSVSRSSDSSQVAGDPSRGTIADGVVVPGKERKEVRTTERVKKKSSWYSVLYPTYKSRSEDFKRIFKDVPSDERLIVDYSCALQKDILVHGRLYVSQNYLCFYANIFRWETQVTIRWKDVTSITKEKTALVIPNAVQICTETEKHFLTSFTARDKTYLMLFRVWQNALLNQQMSMQEMWQWVHTCYGDELGLTSDDEDYIPPVPEDEKPPGLSARYSVDSFSEVGTLQCEEGEPCILHSPYLLSVAGRSCYLPDSQIRDKTATIELEAATTEYLETGELTAEGMNLFLEKTPEQECYSVSESHMEVLEEGEINEESMNGVDPASLPVPLGCADPGELPMQQPPTVRTPSAEILLTDMSDTTESDADKGGGKEETANCTATHEGRKLLRTIFPMHIDQLFTLLFTSSKFMVDFHSLRRTTDIVLAPWLQNPETQLKQRSLTMTVALSQSVGPKSTQVCENQIMLPCSKPGQLYAIDVESSNAGIPYADSFYVTLHYCLTRTSEKESCLSVYAQIKYRKSVWGLVKSFIEKNTWSGLEDFYSSLAKALRVECERCLPSKKKLHRRRRPVTSGPSLLPDVNPHLTPSTPRLLPTHLTAGQPRTTAGPPEALGWLVLVVLLFLVGLNALLYYKLWMLEERAQLPAMDLRVLRNPPRSHDEWLRLLQQQETLHNAEMRKWQRVLQAAVQLLRQTEESLSELQMSISPLVTKKVLSVLKDVMDGGGDGEDHGGGGGSPDKLTSTPQDHGRQEL